MKDDRIKPVEGSYLKDPYIGMPIYLDDDLDENLGMDGEMEEFMDMVEERTAESDENYCRDSNFEKWPLAMGYVPWQSFKETYEPEVALQMGTIFPDLNLPFLGGARG